MRGTGKKMIPQSGKSCFSKREAESKPIASLLFKKGSKMSHCRKLEPKSKSHVKTISSNQSKRKATDTMSPKKRACLKLQGKKEAPIVSSEGDGKDGSGDVKIKKLRTGKKKKKKRRKDKVELDETSRLQRRTRYLLIKMKLEQNLIDAYSTEGWKGQSREKIRPEKELQRAQKQILKCKLGIRDAIHQLDSLSSVGSIADTVIAPDGSVYHEHIFCAKCKLREAFPDNDIVLCDGTCNCAFHQKCLDPPLDTESIPPGDQGWFCKFCECKMEIIEAMNAHIGTHFPVDSNWQDIFKEEATSPDGGDTLLNLEEEWPSDDSGDDDYDPERRENSCSISEAGSDDDASDDVSSSTSLSSSSYGIAFSGSGRWEQEGGCNINISVDSIEDSDETSDGETMCGRRQRRAVDYKKLYAEMFGKDASAYEQGSEDEDWGPRKRRRREKESDAVSTLMTLYESEKKSPNVETIEARQKLPTDHKVRRPIFRIPHNAVEKLRQVFSENELPPRTVRENLSKELGLQPEKVGKWFKNARYTALKARKAERAKHHRSAPKCSKESGLEAVKKKSADDVVLEGTSRGNVICMTKNSTKIHKRKKPNSLSSTPKKNQQYGGTLGSLANSNKGKKPNSLSSTPKKNQQYGDALGSLANSNKVSVEFSDDMSLKKLLKVKKKKESKTVNIAAGCSSQAFEAEMERLCRAKVRLENMKETLLRLQNEKGRKSNKSQLLEKSVMYVPIAELKEKV